MEEEPRRMTPAGLSQLRKSMTRVLSFWKAYGGYMVPKFHFAWHLVQRADKMGNPRFYWTYADESENRTMSTVAKSLHKGRTFYAAFLQKVLPDVCALN